MERRSDDYESEKLASSQPAGRVIRPEGMGVEPLRGPSIISDPPRVVGNTLARTDGYGVTAPAVVAPSRDITRWGPIIAGFFVSLSLIVLLGVLGAALGLQFGATTTQGVAGAPGAATTTTTGNNGTAAVIYGAISLVIAFFMGGWVTGRTAGVGGDLSGWIHGVAVWAVTMTILVVLGAYGLSSAIGAASSSGMVPGSPGTSGVNTGTALNVAQGAAWGTFLALLLGLVASAIGGWVGGRGGMTDLESTTAPNRTVTT